MGEIPISKLLNHYKRIEIQQAILDNAQGKEVAIKYGDKGFGKRPDTLRYPNDILSAVQEGATSFHISEEYWGTLGQLGTNLSRRELDALRTGWDLVLDIDCDHFAYSQIAADLLCKALLHHGAQGISVKFSGNHGFHIGVPFKAFPPQLGNKYTKDLFPEAPRRIAVYLKCFIQEALAVELLRFEDINAIMKRTGLAYDALVQNNTFNPYQVLTIDTVLLASRHLYRSVYSFNEKSGLISIPLEPTSIRSFSHEDALPSNVNVTFIRFLDDATCVAGEARQLLVQAYDYKPVGEKPREDELKEFAALDQAIPEPFFPPCIKLIFGGMDDGKKRALFILVNFLVSCGWSYDMIQARLQDWNAKNKEHLRDTILLGHIKYHKAQQKKVLPPNCQNMMYYNDLGVCQPDSLCAKIKNPVSYAIRKTRLLKQEEPRKKKAPHQDTK
ncbi:hypothetical protein J4464_01945 [Candidatus Woesearchaeota archaeon]|nr:hypothetical protein [Candidatus Woesearchaeota archaeon]